MNIFAELRSATSIFAMIDDHEVANNFAGGALPSSDPRVDNTGSFINETTLYRTALQVLDRQPWARQCIPRSPRRLLHQPPCLFPREPLVRSPDPAVAVRGHIP